MSAIKALKEFVEKNGVQHGDGKIFVFDSPIETDYFDILSVIKNGDAWEYAVDNEGYFFRHVLDEYYAFIMLAHLSKTDQYRDEVKFAMPLGDYDEFSYSTFRLGISNLKKEISYIDTLVNKKKAIDNEEWTLPAMALNMIINDVKHYNRFVENLAQ